MREFCFNVDSQKTEPFENDDVNDYFFGIFKIQYKFGEPEWRAFEVVYLFNPYFGS